jgi:hypothetical protein
MATTHDHLSRVEFDVCLTCIRRRWRQGQPAALGLVRKCPILLRKNNSGPHVRAIRKSHARTNERKLSLQRATGFRVNSRPRALSVPPRSQAMVVRFPAPLRIGTAAPRRRAQSCRAIPNASLRVCLAFAVWYTARVDGQNVVRNGTHHPRDFPRDYLPRIVDICRFLDRFRSHRRSGDTLKNLDKTKGWPTIRRGPVLGQ